MVDVAQLVEPRIVIPAVAGSSPVVHPTFGVGVTTSQVNPESYLVVAPREIPRTAFTTPRHALSDLRRGRAGTADSADNPRRKAFTQSNR
jgi:hypothetical protein